MDINEELSSDDDWTDIEELSSSEDSESEGSHDDDDSETSSGEEDEEAKDKSPPHTILPIGVGNILWNHFGFPVYTDGDFWTRRAVVCTYCHKALRFSAKVFSKMRSHLQKCNKGAYRHMAIKSLQTPLKELILIPNVLLNMKEGEKVYQKYQEKLPAPNEPEGERYKHLKDHMFNFAMSTLDAGLAAEKSPFVNFVQQMVSDPSSLPSFGQGQGFIKDQIPIKYEQVKKRLVEILQKCSEYSMSIEEWTDDEETNFLTFSVNHLTAKGLKNSVVLTRPKNLDELPDALNAISKNFSVDQKKVVAVVTNSDINFAEYWDAEAKTQFIASFPDILMVAVKEHLFKLPSVDDLLLKLEYNPAGISDFQVLLSSLEDRFEHAKGWDLSEGELLLFSKMMTVVGALRLAVDTVCYEEPVAFISILWPIIFTLQTKFLKPDLTQDDWQIAEMKKVVGDFLVQTYKPVLPFLQSATLVDPRFRQLNYVADNEASKKSILGQLKSMIEKRAASKGSGASALDSTTQAEVEYSNFKTEQPVDFMLSPLIWWDTPGALKVYPDLRQVAWMYNCVPICCIPTERLKADDTYLEKKRASLEYFDIDPMLFLQSNVSMISLICN